MYRDELSAQVQHKKVISGMGNMTGVEKELNKDDLLAYKKSDTN